MLKFSGHSLISGVVISGFVVIGLSGCGFKSDLSPPKSDTKTPLFESDVQPTVEMDDTLLPESAAGATGEVVQLDLPVAETSLITPEVDPDSGVEVDITSIAFDGDILVSPGSENADSKATSVDASEGIPVDIDDLFSDVDPN